MTPPELVHDAGTMAAHAERLATTEQQINDLRRWQERQNGSIQRIEERLDRLFWGVAGTAVGVAVQLLLVFLRGRPS